jgi:hypothetical protein
VAESKLKVLLNKNVAGRTSKEAEKTAEEVDKVSKETEKTAEEVDKVSRETRLTSKEAGREG